jgi:hypothetical protein
MLSKSIGRATAAALVLFMAASCARMLPWQNERLGDEVNFAFSLRDNIVTLDTLRVDGLPGRFILGTASPVTVIDPGFSLHTGSAHSVNLSDKQTIRITPQRLSLGGVADGIIGADTWRRHALTIDYKSGLVTYQKEGIHPGQMTIFRYTGAPSVTVSVDGRDLQAVVDTTSPDTLVLPRASVGRGSVRILIAGTDFGATDVQFSSVTQARIGNRLLSHFLVTIDYGKNVVGLWRDPRVPLGASIDATIDARRRPDADHDQSR